MRKLTWISALILMAGLFACAGKADKNAAAAGEKPSLKPKEVAGQQGQVAQSQAPTTNIKFAEEEFDFGAVAEGEKVRHVYNFTNTGDKPLIITDAKASCGCTVPDWPDKPIAPGETGEIEVVFNSAGRMGNQTKIISVTANTDPPITRVKLKGVVEKKNS